MRDVSDTALLTAEMRARETARPDRLFDDPFAAILSGERAKQIAPIRRRLVSSGGTVARTVALDEMIVRLLGDRRFPVVVNLGAGLDARPYRLDLPPDLRWVELDLPGIVDHKEALLADEQPRCQLTRYGVDLADSDVRRTTLGSALAGDPALVISEGVLPYLWPADVEALVSDVTRSASELSWCLDLVSPLLLRVGNLFGGRKLATAQSTAHFAPEEGADYFRRFGLHPVEQRSVWLEQRRLDREPRPMKVAWTIAHGRARDALEQIQVVIALESS